ncbi:MAG: PQQ-dependent sugar dehydrogenase [Deltaproteobacteria bacterium]|nr:PQQ-dependent sugar dehydrogenase [Deltaproteobacteria bacterium]
MPLRALPLPLTLLALSILGCPGAPTADDDFASANDDDGADDDDDDAADDDDTGDDDDASSDDDDGDDDDSASPCASGPPVGGAAVILASIGAGLERPVDVRSAGDGSGRIFVAEQRGIIQVFAAGDPTPTSWFDINAQVVTPGGLGDERGLLALAFHPGFATNGLLYVHYNDTSGDTVVSEFTVASPPDGTPSLTSERVILAVSQPANNHNGGSIHFGPDGYLYVGLGDGGGAGDSYANGQNETTLLAKILRLDVDNPADGNEYGIPADNPFLSSPVADEAFVWGLRNPWRWSFDRATGAMWIADVGQNAREEIDLGVAGANYGWPCREASADYDGCGGSFPNFEDPIFEYQHSDGISVTGGYVYRGCRLPDLQGQYFFSDFAYAPSSPLWSISASGAPGDVWENDVGLLIATFGEDEDGELLVADYDGGTLHRMVPQ